MTLYIQDQVTFTAKRKQLADDGPSYLHIVADFDGTLTRSKFDGQQIHSTIALIREGGYLSPEYVAASFALADKYRPIEKSSTATTPEKIAAMQDWWEQHLALMVKHGMHRSVIDDIVCKDMVQARPRLSQFFDLAHCDSVPVLIFSAGLGDIIAGFLQRQHLNMPDVHIVSNFFTYDAKDAVTGYESRIIHSLNKNEVTISDTYYAAAIQDRKNVLLLGDGLGDLGMADGMCNDTVLSVGFLNGNTHHLEAFARNFDAVVLEDEGFEDAYALLEQIVRRT